MTPYPAEGIAWLYALLFGTQVYLAYLALMGMAPRLGRIATTLTYATLACAFLFLTLGTIQPPLLDLVQYRWLLRGSYVAYLLLSLYTLMRFWVGLVRRRGQGS